LVSAHKGDELIGHAETALFDLFISARHGGSAQKGVEHISSAGEIQSLQLKMAGEGADASILILKRHHLLHAPEEFCRQFLHIIKVWQKLYGAIDNKPPEHDLITAQMTIPFPVWSQKMFKIHFSQTVAAKFLKSSAQGSPVSYLPCFVFSQFFSPRSSVFLHFPDTILIAYK
jgi:hypothetical protein